MARGSSKEVQAMTAGVNKVNGSANGGALFRQRCICLLDDTGFKGASGDDNIIAKLPAGAVIKQIDVVSSVNLTTSTLAFGVSGATGKYGAAKAYGTTPEAMVTYVATSALDDDATAASQDILMTVGSANLPTTGGAKIIVDIIYSARG